MGKNYLEFLPEDMGRFRKIFAGFSGGADSTALLLLLNEYAGTYGYGLEAVHFEHGLRGEESMADAEWCRSFCELRNIPFRLVSLEMEPDNSNIEAEARGRRLNAWREIVNPETDAAALGHHADDRIENLFLRLLRGSNSSGLASMRKIQDIDGITFIRPLLNLRRGDILVFLKSRGIEDWRTDSTNDDNNFRRNFIRNMILPLFEEAFPDPGNAVLKSLTAIEHDADFLEAAARGKYLAVTSECSEGFFPQPVLEKLHPALLPRFLRLWLKDTCGTDVIPTAAFIERFADACISAGTEKITIPLNNGISAVFADGKVSIFPPGSTENKIAFSDLRIEWHWKEEPEIFWHGIILSCCMVNGSGSEICDSSHRRVSFPENKLPDTLIVRGRLPGDRMIPFGGDKPVRLKKLLAGRRDKQSVPVVTLPDDSIIWIPGVRRANFADIAAGDKGELAVFSASGDPNCG